MVTVDGNPKAIASDAARLDGESKTTAEIKAAGFFETLFDSDTAWTYAEGKLPGFGAAVELPAHLLAVGAAPFEGAGTSESPYKISTAADLAKLAELVNAGESFCGKYFELQNDLDLSGYVSGEGWMPIGTSINPFMGIFDGNVYEIANLTINRANSSIQGLFGYIASGGTVKPWRGGRKRQWRLRCRRRGGNCYQRHGGKLRRAKSLRQWHKLCRARGRMGRRR